MTIDTLEALFLHHLRGVLYAERKFLRALPLMAAKVAASGPKPHFAACMAQTKEHLARLERVFAVLDIPARGIRCETMVGLISEMEWLTVEIVDPATLDAALVALLRTMEHCLIARYGSLFAWATQLGSLGMAAQFRATLDSRQASDRALTRWASGQPRIEVA